MRGSTQLLVAALFAVGFAPVAAHAFDEQKAAPESIPGVTVVAPDTATKGSDGTTALDIPGLGTIGSIPKLDFGLDLLYGSTDEQRAAAETLPDDDEGLRIRGSVRHRF